MPYDTLCLNSIQHDSLSTHRNTFFYDLGEIVPFSSKNVNKM